MYMYLYVDCLLHLLLSVGFILNQFGIDLIKSNRTSVEARWYRGITDTTMHPLEVACKKSLRINLKRDVAV